MAFKLKMIIYKLMYYILYFILPYLSLYEAKLILLLQQYDIMAMMTTFKVYVPKSKVHKFDVVCFLYL